MKKYARLWVVLCMLLVSGMLYYGCAFRPYEYRGEYPDLYSVGINSVLGSQGYRASEGNFPPDIYLLEEDGHGRKLFRYSERNLVSTQNLIISQKSDDGYVYFYPDYNLIAAPENNFTEKEIEALKKENDWGKEIDLSKCIRTEIVHLKAIGPIADRRLTEVYTQIYGENAENHPLAYISFFASDAQGRALYVFEKHRGRDDGGYDIQCFVVMFNKDGSFDPVDGIMEIADVWGYQDEMKEFKERSGWHMPAS